MHFVIANEAKLLTSLDLLTSWVVFPRVKDLCEKNKLHHNFEGPQSACTLASFHSETNSSHTSFGRNQTLHPTIANKIKLLTFLD